MKRKVIAAALLLSPMLLHAQASAPAQPETSSTVRVSKLVKPKELAALASPDRTTTATTTARVSSGVVAPKLIHTSEINWDADNVSAEKTAVISLMVDAAGKPSELKMVQSINPIMDKNVLEAVSHYRFAPATLDNQPTAVPLNLQITVRRPSEQ